MDPGRHRDRCLAITTLLVYVERDGYKDGNGTPISLLDALYYATVTLSTTGYGDIVPVTDQARLANVLIITPLRSIFLITLVGTTVEVLTQRSRDEFRIKRWRQRCRTTGHHRVRREGVGCAQHADRAGHARVVGRGRHERPHLLGEATALGATGVLGDATREDVLTEGAAPRAKRIIVALDRDDTAVSSRSRRGASTRPPRSSRRCARARTSTSSGRAVPTP